MTGIIFDIKKFSIHDGPGIRTTIFFKGCPLRCVWCHNPEGQEMSSEIMLFPDRCSVCGSCVSVCPDQAIIPKDVSGKVNGVHPSQAVALKGACCEITRARPDPSIALKEGSGGDSGSPGMNTLREKCTACGECVKACPSGAREVAGRIATVDGLVDEISKDVVFYDTSGGGVTFSGGEPLMQPDFLIALLKECRKREIHTAVDTCGLAKWETLSAIVPYVDLILYDLKCMDASVHVELTGRSNEAILENLRRLSKTHSNVSVRFPLVPGINDNDGNIVSMGEFVSSLRGKHAPPRVDILPYHKMGADKYTRLGKVYRMPEITQPTDELVHDIREKLARFGLETRVGG